MYIQDNYCTKNIDVPVGFHFRDEDGVRDESGDEKEVKCFWLIINQNFRFGNKKNSNSDEAIGVQVSK
jgi:hypothetical protein